MERVYNVEKSNVRKPSAEADSTDVPPKKKYKVSSLYPPLDHSQAADDITFERHYSAMENELSKDKPRKEVVANLMRQTFIQRRDFVLNDAESVSQILGRYSGLKLPDIVSLWKMEKCLNLASQCF